MTEAEREQEQAMVLLGTHGSTACPPEQWHGWRWAEQGYAPEFLGFDDRGGHDASDCVTVLHNGFGEFPDVPGYGKVHEFVPGECSCPWCGDGTGEEGKRAECQLCEGNGLIYWGEEWSVVVLAPNTEVWGYGSGMAGCLFDYGPEYLAGSKADAIDAALFIFDDLPEAELAAAREALNDCGTYYFSDAATAGAQLVQVWQGDASDLSGGES